MSFNFFKMSFNFDAQGCVHLILFWYVISDFKRLFITLNSEIYS